MAPQTGKKHGISKTTPSPKRKAVGEKEFVSSPPRKSTVVNCVIEGSTNGLMFLSCERNNSGDDAYVKEFSDQLVNPERSDSIKSLRIDSFCARRIRDGKGTDDFMTNTHNIYTRKQFVHSAEDPEDVEDPGYRRQWSESLISELNLIPWRFPQRFQWGGDLTANPPHKSDYFLLNDSIGSVYGNIFNSYSEVVADSNCLDAAFEYLDNRNNAAAILCSGNWKQK
ncbi:MAG: hypothetical protein ACRDL7_05365 [Gaiellaceae bacterium]